MGQEVLLHSSEVSIGQRNVPPVDFDSYRHNLCGYPVTWEQALRYMGPLLTQGEQTLVNSMLPNHEGIDRHVSVFVPKDPESSGILVLSDTPFTVQPTGGVDDDDPYSYMDLRNAVRIIPSEDPQFPGTVDDEYVFVDPQQQSEWEPGTLLQGLQRLRPEFQYSAEHVLEEYALSHHPDRFAFKSADTCFEGLFFRVNPRGKLELVIQRTARFLADFQVDAARMVLEIDPDQTENPVSSGYETRVLSEDEF